jgi:hypothetical protein
MSSSLLSKRLGELERAGVISRKRLEGERGHRYELTDAGRALGPLVLSIGMWSREWLNREVRAEDADPALLMWDMQRNLDHERLPQDRLVVFFRFRDAPDGKRAWWLVGEPGGADLCVSDPGFEVDLRVDAESVAMAKVWIGQLELGAAMRSGRIRVTGPDDLVRSLPDWLGRSVLAHPDPVAELARRETIRAT